MQCQPLTQPYRDCLLPTVNAVPDFAVQHFETPSRPPILMRKDAKGWGKAAFTGSGGSPSGAGGRLGIELVNVLLLIGERVWQCLKASR